jgi:hypothetical protein
MARVIESASAKAALRTNAQLEVIVEQVKTLHATITTSRGRGSTRSTAAIGVVPRCGDSCPVVC